MNNTIKILTSITIALAILLININNVNNYHIEPTYRTTTLEYIIIETNNTYEVCNPINNNLRYLKDRSGCKSYTSTIVIINAKAYHI